MVLPFITEKLKFLYNWNQYLYADQLLHVKLYYFLVTETRRE